MGFQINAHRKVTYLKLAYTETGNNPREGLLSVFHNSPSYSRYKFEVAAKNAKRVIEPQSTTKQIGSVRVRL